MSGGYFDYWQYHINRIADDVEQVIRNNDSKELNEWGDTIGCNYSAEVIAEFERGLRVLREAAIYAQRFDWLLCGDDGEDSFLKRLAQELEELRNDSNRS